jgi:DNA-3-methyladenine glycosylase
MYDPQNILPTDFYLRPVTIVAQELLGKVIITCIDGHYTKSLIVETEAYEYPFDKGSHTYLHRRTPKNESMYLKGGHLYIYTCYGIHDMMNIVTEDENSGTAVLIRAVEPIEGLEIMQKRRNCFKNDHTLTGGPGKVCEALGIKKQHDALKLNGSQSEILIISHTDNPSYLCVCPRVGMSSRVAECANYPYRYYINSRCVSRPLSVFYQF